DGDTAPKTFTIPITDDTLVEGNETVQVYLDSPSPGSALATPYEAVLTITDNDVASAGSLGFAWAPPVRESDGGATITVERVGGSAGVVTVRYTTLAGFGAQP